MTCGLPSASKICGEAVNVPPTAAFESRLLIVPNNVVATGARRIPGGTEMLPGCPVVTIAPVSGSMVVNPCTGFPSDVTSRPLASNVKLPARV